MQIPPDCGTFSSAIYAVFSNFAWEMGGVPFFIDNLRTDPRIHDFPLDFCSNCGDYIYECIKLTPPEIASQVRASARGRSYYRGCMNPERLIFYIDGFNLYFGLRERGWRKYYWLNLQEMCSRLIRSGQELVKVQYFTARINQAKEDKRRRQLTYLEALTFLST